MACPSMVIDSFIFKGIIFIMGNPRVFNIILVDALFKDHCNAKHWGLFSALHFSGPSIYCRLPEMENEKPIYASHPVLRYSRNSGDSDHEQRLKFHIPVGNY